MQIDGEAITSTCYTVCIGIYVKIEDNVCVSVCVRVYMYVCNVCFNNNQWYLASEYLVGSWPCVLFHIHSCVYIYRLFEAIESPKRIHLVMEHLGGSNLCSYVKAKKRLAEDEAREVFRQLVEGLDYIHGLSIIHRDIKLEVCCCFIWVYD